MTERPYDVGDRVRIDIPDEADPEHGRLHGRSGEIAAVLEDDAHAITGDTRDGVIYRVELSDGTHIDLRRRDLRPR